MSDQLLGPRHTHRTESTASPDLACRPQRQIEVGRGARGPINKDTCLFFFFVGGGGGLEEFTSTQDSSWKLGDSRI